jgi:hypothetical protein
MRDTLSLGSGSMCNIRVIFPILWPVNILLQRSLERQRECQMMRPKGIPNAI